MSKNSDDIYDRLLEEAYNLESLEVETAGNRKWRIFKIKAQSRITKIAAQYGFIIEALVGGRFGFIVGCWSAI
jgi:hypothetical protein